MNGFRSPEYATLYMTAVHPVATVALRETMRFGRRVQYRDQDLRMPLAGGIAILDAGVLVERPGRRLNRRPTAQEYEDNVQRICECLAESGIYEELVRLCQLMGMEEL